MDKGSLVPNLSIKDADGADVQLWDLRQKSHVVLVHDPGATTERVAAHKKALASLQKTLDWLGARPLLSPYPVNGLEAGIHLIDKFGHYIGHLSLDDGWSKIENEILYYEARHC